MGQPAHNPLTHGPARSQFAHTWASPLTHGPARSLSKLTQAHEEVERSFAFQTTHSASQIFAKGLLTIDCEKAPSDILTDPPLPPYFHASGLVPHHTITIPAHQHAMYPIDNCSNINIVNEMRHSDGSTVAFSRPSSMECLCGSDPRSAHTLKAHLELSRRLRRMKRRLFLEAVGQEYINTVSDGTLRTMQSLDSNTTETGTTEIANEA